MTPLCSYSLLSLILSVSDVCPSNLFAIDFQIHKNGVVSAFKMHINGAYCTSHSAICFLHSIKFLSSIPFDVYAHRASPSVLNCSTVYYHDDILYFMYKFFLMDICMGV